MCDDFVVFPIRRKQRRQEEEEKDQERCRLVLRSILNMATCTCIVLIGSVLFTIGDRKTKCPKKPAKKKQGWMHMSKVIHVCRVI